MEFTASSKTATATAAGILITGFAVILRSVSGDDVAGSIGGACLVMVGLSLVILVFVKHWVVNTSAERRALAVTQQLAQDERTKYVAAQAILEGDQVRLYRDLAAEKASLAAAIVAERKKMRADFEEERATICAEAFQTGAEMERAGMLKPGKQPQRGNLIRFPKQEQQPVQAPQRERSREHGVVGP